MAKPSRKTNGSSQVPRGPRQAVEDRFAQRYPPRPVAGPPESVDPGWLIKAGALAILAALTCAYATLCLLVSQGQWQLLLHPAPGNLTSLADSQPVHFGAGATGQPELTGLWLPSKQPTPLTTTLLVLGSGNGNLQSHTEMLTQLHTLPVNVFAFDYRGFGASASPTHPSEVRMTEDAESALRYLTGTRHLSGATVVPYGVGLGGALAATLAANHPELPAVLLEAPQPDAAAAALADRRAHLVPLRLFLHERFDVSASLSSLKTPKLLLDTGPSGERTPTAAFTRLGRSAAPPSLQVHLQVSNQTPSPALWRAAVLRFLDEYLPHAPIASGAQP